MKGCYIFVCLSAFVVALTVTVLVHHHYYHGEDASSSAESAVGQHEEVHWDRPDLDGIRVNALISTDPGKGKVACPPECYKVSGECRCHHKSVTDY